jgi:hypothetical protein
MNISTSSRLVAVLLLAIACALLGGCGFGQSKKDADTVLTRHFQTIATNGYASATADYGSQFFQSTTKEAWGKTLDRLTTKLGTYQSHTITGWRVFKKAGTRGAGTTVSVQCQVTYTKHSARESFTLFKGVTDSDYKIIGHQIDGAALLQE